MSWLSKGSGSKSAPTPPPKAGAPSDFSAAPAFVTLRISPTRTSQEAAKNAVIVNPEDLSADCDHVLVDGKHILPVEFDPTVPKGTMNMNSSARTWTLAEMTNGGLVSVKPYDAEKEGVAFLASIEFKVEFTKATQFNPNMKPFKAQDIVTKLKASQIGRVFAIGQPILYEASSNNFLKLTVNSLMPVDLAELGGSVKTKTSRSDRGLLSEKTNFELVAATEGTVVPLEGGKGGGQETKFFRPDFNFEQIGVGGMDKEFGTIFRRAFTSRLLPPSVLQQFGINHVKGIILYGPPGTGKTTLARQIGKMLNSKDPKIINGPEILNSYVGESEKNIRKLFEDAEADQAAKGAYSDLHLIIFDELDALCKKRGSTNNGTGVGDSIVNQLLTKIDGVKKLDNILIIGMTNRLDLIDEALLREGRLEVHIEVSLPDEAGRIQIFKIHTAEMRKNNRLDQDVDLLNLAERTKNFTGAEIEGLVRAATSYAITRHRGDSPGAQIKLEDTSKITVKQMDFLTALERGDVKASFGSAKAEDQVKKTLRNGIIPFHPSIDDILRKGDLYVQQVATSSYVSIVSVLLYGSRGCGKSALALKIAQNSGFPLLKVISPDNYVGQSESTKCADITKEFYDAYKSESSVVVVDDVERLLEYVPLGPRFSNTVLQTLSVLLRKEPKPGHRLLVLATTSKYEDLMNLGLHECFDDFVPVPLISEASSVDHVLSAMDTLQYSFDERSIVRQTLHSASQAHPFSIGIKRLITLADANSRQESDRAEKLAASILNS